MFLRNRGHGNGVNANPLRRWVTEVEMRPPAPSTPSPGIRIELQRGTATVAVTWSTSADGVRGVDTRAASMIRVEAL